MKFTNVLSYTFLRRGVFLILSLTSLKLTAQEKKCETGTVVFIRMAHKLKSAASCQVFSGDTLVGKIANNSAFMFNQSPGTFSFTPVIHPGNKKGEPIELNIEAGGLTVVEIKIKEKRQGSILPSESFYFSFVPLHPRLYKKFLRKKEVGKSIREALWEAFLSKYD
ncbi:MAG: hypothetical protein AAFR66_23125 [Bacteroidota bacterium]